MLKKVVCELERPARKGGGDRYKAITDISNAGSDFTIYIPQSISRPGGTPLARIVIEFKKED